MKGTHMYNCDIAVDNRAAYVMGHAMGTLVMGNTFTSSEKQKCATLTQWLHETPHSVHNFSCCLFRNVCLVIQPLAYFSEELL